MTIALTLQKYLVASVVSDARQDCALLVSPCYRFNLHHLGCQGATIQQRGGRVLHQGIADDGELGIAV